MRQDWRVEDDSQETYSEQDNDDENTVSFVKSFLQLNTSSNISEKFSDRKKSKDLNLSADENDCE